MPPLCYSVSSSVLFFSPPHSFALTYCTSLHYQACMVNMQMQPLHPKTSPSRVHRQVELRLQMFARLKHNWLKLQLFQALSWPEDCTLLGTSAVVGEAIRARICMININYLNKDSALGTDVLWSAAALTQKNNSSLITLTAWYPHSKIKETTLPWPD